MSLRKKFLAATVLAGAATVLFSSGALAYDGKWYVGAGGGWEHMQDGWANNRFSVDDGWIADARIGTKPAGQNFRFEGDLSYRDNTVASNAGHIKIFSLMLNALYDFDTGTPFRPYLGAGGGGANVEYKVNGNKFSFDNSNAKLAGQLIAGLAYDFSPNLSVNVEYRYFAANGVKFAGVVNAVPTKLHEAFENHSVLAGLTWTFGQAAPPPPPPAPAPPPPPPPPQAALPVFKIFFPWNVSKLTPEAKKTVDEIASQYKDKKIEKIHIEGNTDTSGTSDYNMGLGDKRADSVKAELIAQGIPDGVIDTLSRGETNPAVQTGDNVREPLNRRAEVTIQVQ